MAGIDQRDGIADGQHSNVPLQCPECGQVSSPRLGNSAYCGLEFDISGLG